MCRHCARCGEPGLEVVLSLCRGTVWRGCWAVNLVIRDACHAASSFQTLVLQGRSLLLFSTENRLRTFLFWLVKNAYFEALVLALIIFNCVLLAMDNPSVTDGSTLRLVRWRRERMASGSPCHKRVPVGNHGTDLLCRRCVSVPHVTRSWTNQTSRSLPSSRSRWCPNRSRGACGSAASRRTSAATGTAWTRS